MEFKKIIKTSRFLDPFQKYIQAERHSEVRIDPLTGSSTRILDLPVKQLERVDTAPMADLNRQLCPFCPGMVDQITPKFDPALFPREKYRSGQALCFPNAFPYDENGAVTVMCEKHYVQAAEFDERMVGDALSCCVEYLKDVSVKQPEAVYQSINWNYLPLAGSSIVHPHLQVMASSSPTNYYSMTTASLKRYRDGSGGDFWGDLVRLERDTGERFIGEAAGVSWLIAFAPLGIFDVIGIAHYARRPADIAGALADEIARGIVRTLRFIDSLNMYSFNMAIYFVVNDDLFTPHVRICPRVSLPPLGTSEINYMRMLHNETLTPLKPEEICSMIRPFWR